MPAALPLAELFPLPQPEEAVQNQLRRLLGEAYAALPLGVGHLPMQLNRLIEQLAAALAAQTQRDEQAFQSDLTAFIPNLRRFALSLTKNAARADDLLQDTLLKAWRFRSSFAMGTNHEAWFMTIMRNTFYSSTRKGEGEAGFSGDEADRMATVPSQLDALAVQDVQRALANIRAPMRQALVLVTIDGLSYEQAAERMNCQVGTVKSRVWRAREILAAMLGFSGEDLGADHLTLSVVSGQGSSSRI